MMKEDSWHHTEALTHVPTHSTTHATHISTCKEKNNTKRMYGVISKIMIITQRKDDTVYRSHKKWNSNSYRYNELFLHDKQP